MKDLTPAELRARLEGCLYHLADPADRQDAYLRGIGVGGLADELALEFEDVFRQLEPLLRERPEAQRLVQALQRLEHLLDDPTLQWSIQDLRESEQWREIRIVAAGALQALRAMG